MSTQACSPHTLKQYLSADAVKLPCCCVRRLCKWKPVSTIKEDSLDEKMEYVQKIKQEMIDAWPHWFCPRRCADSQMCFVLTFSAFLISQRTKLCFHTRSPVSLLIWYSDCSRCRKRPVWQNLGSISSCFMGNTGKNIGTQSCGLKLERYMNDIFWQTEIIRRQMKESSRRRFFYPPNSCLCGFGIDSGRNFLEDSRSKRREVCFGS